MSVLPSTALITEVLNLIKNDTPHMALFTTAVAPDGIGTELTGGSYARKPITFGSITGGTMKNTAVVAFAGVPTAEVTHYAIFDAVTAGNLLVYGEVNDEIVVLAGDEIDFPVGNIEINLAGN